MRVDELLARGRTLSFEFFPPKTDEAQVQLNDTISELTPLHPNFFSVTYGAQGGERTRTRDVVVAMAHSGSVPPVAHLTCVGHTREEISALLAEYEAAGVKNILALGGDIPADPAQLGPSDFRYAQDLVEYVRANFDICIGVAAHPEVHPRSVSRESDRQHLADKLRLADFAMTQFFFDVDHYRRMIDELGALGVHKPVSGSELPQWLTDRLAPLESPADIRKAGVEIATQLCAELMAAGAPGLHIYTLNRSVAAREIAINLGLGQA